MIVLYALIAGVTLDVRMTRTYNYFNEALGDAETLFTSLPPNVSLARPGGAASSLPPFVLPVLDHIEAWGTCAFSR